MKQYEWMKNLKTRRVHFEILSEVSVFSRKEIVKLQGKFGPYVGELEGDFQSLGKPALLTPKHKLDGKK